MADAPKRATLKDITAYFVRSTGDEDLSDANRAFAAKCALLAAHVQRVEALALGANAKAGAAAETIAELTEYMVEEKQKGEAPRAAANGSGPPPGPPPESEAGGGDDDDEEAATQAMVDKIAAETEAEARAGGTPPVPITALRKGKGKPAAPPPGAAADGAGEAS